MSCNCQACDQCVINDACGCGCGCPKPWVMSAGCHHCPPKPQPPPCGYRLIGEVREPVWHPIHPMIPSLLQCHFGLINSLMQTNCIDEADRDQQLACLLSESEAEITTCQFPGDSYLIALRYRAIALLELRELMQLWRSGIAAALMNGKTPSYQAPSLCDTEHGQKLKDLERRTALPIIMGM